MKKPPIIVVIGHVDHGKTTLLDYIKKTNITAKEAGGITQAIGAYEVVRDDKKITFIDTPGHEAFSKMRARGSRAADIAVLVVAADEGVKPQTKEALRIIKETKIPFVVAINKMDKNNIDIDRTISGLSQEGVLLEGYGGDVSWKAISAKTGDGVDSLLDLILLLAEIEELIFDPDVPARGFVLESYRDSRRGIVASAIVQDGTLRVGEEITTGLVVAKIKMLEDWRGRRIKEAIPSAPVLILGFNEVPEIGSEFIVGGKVAAEVKKDVVSLEKSAAGDGEEVLNLIIKANDSGSLEALFDIIKNIKAPEGYRVNIISWSVGDVTDGDVKMAVSVKAMIIGFKVKINKAAANLAKEQKVKIKTSQVIYELTSDLEEWLLKFKQAVILGDLEVLGVFGKKSGSRYIIGGKVIEGAITNNVACKIKRGDREIGSGRIINLQKNKQDTNQVEQGKEAGLLVDSDVNIKIGDHIVVYES